MNRSERGPSEGSRGSSRTRRLLGIFALLGLAACGGGGGGGGGNDASNGVTPPTFLTQPQATTVADGQPANFGVIALGTAPLTYQWSRNGTAIAGATSATYAVPSTTLADSGTNFTVVVAGPGGTATSNAARLTVTPVAPRITNDQPQTVSVVAGQSATLTVVVTGSAPLTYQWRRNGAAITGATAATYATPAATGAEQGAVYDVVVTNAGGSVTSSAFTLSVTGLAIAPTITTQPMSVTVRVGDPATFTVVATGTAPLRYQWRRGATPLVGVDGPTYTLPAVTAADNGAVFLVAVINDVGGVDSIPAILTVVP